GLPAGSDFHYFLRVVPGAFAYLMNYLPQNISLGHLWSVSCEMQIYLLAPLIFFLGGEAALRRKLVWGAVLVLLVASGMAQPFIGEGKKYHFEFAVWPMMFGFCCEYQKAWLARVSRRWASPLIRLSLCLLAGSFLLMLFG